MTSGHQSLLATGIGTAPGPLYQTLHCKRPLGNRYSEPGVHNPAARDPGEPLKSTLQGPMDNRLSWFQSASKAQTPAGSSHTGTMQSRPGQHTCGAAETLEAENQHLWLLVLA